MTAPSASVQPKPVPSVPSAATTFQDAPPAASDRSAPPVAPLPVIKPPDFYHADTNFDAKIEFDEAKKIWPQLTRRYFEEFDLEGTGFLNADEYYLLVRHPPK